MLNRIIKISLSVFLFISIIGCKSTPQKMREVVDSYNRSAQLMSNDIMRGTKAEITDRREIELTIYTNVPFKDEHQQELYKQIYPALIKGTFRHGQNSPLIELLNEGVTFTITLRADNNRRFDSFHLDKAKFDELNKDKNNSIDNLSSTETVNLPKELTEALNILNESLPIEDKTEGTKIIKIDITSEKELAYTLEVPDDYINLDLLKNEESKKLLKDEILADPNIRATSKMMREYDIDAVKYIYVNKQGKVLGEISTK